MKALKQFGDPKSMSEALIEIWKEKDWLEIENNNFKWLVKTDSAN